MPSGMSSEPARVLSYELEVPIRGTRSAVWHALTQELPTWWLRDFHVIDPKSEMQFEPIAGGALREVTEEGASLLWYTVQMIVPGESLHLVGHIAPDWGGPMTSSLKIWLLENADTCTVCVADALVGSVSEEHATAQRDGWLRLFETGLKGHVEA